MALKLLLERPFNPDIVSPWKGMKRCALKLDGTVYKYHNPNITGNSTNAMFEDGTTMTWVDYENAGYNCMVEIPKFYYKKVGFNESLTNFENGHIWYISDTPVNGFDLHPAFMRCRDKLCDDLNGVATEVSYRYAPAFLGWVDRQGRLRSLPNKSPQTDIILGDSRNKAKANGNGWGVLDYNLYFATQLLYVVEYGSYDSQTALGRGYVDDNSSKINTGGTLQYGNKSYGESTGKKQISYRGIEDFWGNCRYWIDGFYCDGNRNILIGNKGFNDVGNGYSNKGQGATVNVSGYIGNIQANKECGFIISATKGSTTTKLYDEGFLYAGNLPVAGGWWRGNFYAGAFHLACAYPAYTKNSSIAISLTF